MKYRLYFSVACSLYIKWILEKRKKEKEGRRLIFVEVLLCIRLWASLDTCTVLRVTWRGMECCPHFKMRKQIQSSYETCPRLGSQQVVSQRLGILILWSSEWLTAPSLESDQPGTHSGSATHRRCDLHQVLNLSVPLFTHLHSKDNGSIHLIELQ